MIEITSDQLKNKLNEELVIKILTEIGCHSIKKQKNKIIAANKDGDNSAAVNVYLNNFYTNNYTRSDFQSRPYRDIITLVEFSELISSSQAIKKICEICGFNYYEKKTRTPKFLEWLTSVEPADSKNEIDDELIRPLPERVLKQFNIKPVKKWIDEGITFSTQASFQIGFDISTERIVIPIRDEIGSLVGIKGRLLEDEKAVDDKYIYLYSCPKTKILFGLYQNYKDIIEKNEVIVVEGEKGVLKLYSLGYKNVVAIGSKSMSRTQIDKLLRLGVPITIALDKDVSEEEISVITKELKCPLNTSDVFVLQDKMNFLDKKESPMDSSESWEVLYNNFKVKV